MKTVARLTKVAAMLALVVYGLAALHCFLEGVPGFDFLKTCCFADSGAANTGDCESGDCAVESGKYRAEELTVSVPQPPLLLALLFVAIELPLPEPQLESLVASESPPELPKIWQFYFRTALPPRAPSIAS
ncbi:MAG: hypothetical protein JNN01_20070 [Opitutaceae bacterium]|nr:hypothetical protein [Opitutaceae bacterium]